MDAGEWRGVFTIVMFVLFIGICVWAWSSRRKDDFDEAAQLPLDDELPITDELNEGR
jgi:cytochrome c oxidase cbb3-type subunit 4